LAELNFTLCGTEGTANVIKKSGIKCKKVNKVSAGSPHIVDILNAKKIALVINTGGGKRIYRVQDSTSLRRATLINKVPYCTNMSTALACIEGIKALKSKKINVTPIQNI
jgi:carbamoyl-phosphate synthase large subunit